MCAASSYLNVLHSVVSITIKTWLMPFVQYHRVAVKISLYNKCENDDNFTNGADIKRLRYEICISSS